MMRRINWLLTSMLIATMLMSGCSSSSDTPTAPGNTDDVTAPAAPVNLSAQVTENAISIAWSSNSEADLASYKLYRSWNHGDWEYVCDCSAATFEDQAPPRTLSHVAYAVSAMDLSGNESTLSGTLEIGFDPGNNSPNVVAH